MVAAQNARLTLFIAPAGYGKTVSMAQVAEEMAAKGIASVWLTLDASDNDLERLLQSLDAATRRLAEPAGDNGGVLSADRFVERFFRASRPYALFLDDFEQIDDPSALKLVKEIVRSTPAHGRIFIGSRTLPAIGLARLRTGGGLVEIDTARLQFSEQEMAQFLSRGGATMLHPAELQNLYQRTEGWPVAVRLASTILDAGADPKDFVNRFSGSQTEMSAYLAEEILMAQPEDIRQFLLRTSLFKAFDAGLCDAVFGQHESDAIIDRLIATGVPISKAAEADIYKYHSLFRSYLQARLERERPAEVVHLHHQAMIWSQSQGRMVAAVEHAIACARYEDAVDFLRGIGFSLLEQGRVRLLSRWFDCLPAGLMKAAPKLQIIQAWATCFTAGPRAAEDVLDRYGLASSDDAPSYADAMCMRPMIHAMLDDYPAAHEAGAAASAHFAAASRYTREVFHICMANVYASLGLANKAREHLDLSDEDDPRKNRAVFSAMYAEALRGIIDLQDDNFRNAKARFDIAVRTRRDGEIFSFNGMAWAGVLHAYAYYEVNELDRAAHLLRFHLPFVRDAGMPDHLIMAFTFLSRVSFEEGDIDEAYRLLVELEAAGKRNGLRRVVAGARLERARLFLRQDNSASAAIQLADLEGDEVWLQVQEQRLIGNDLDTLELAQIRLFLHEQRAGEALTLIETEIADARRSSRLRRLLALRLLEAAALLMNGDLRRARTTMRSALMKCAREGYIRLIVDEGAEVARAVRLYAQPAIEDRLGRSNPVFASYLNRLLDALPPSPDRPEPTTGTGPDHLTPKEIDVLRLLAEGYSNARLSKHFCVSDSTIRTHLRNINAKLDATSRGDAVARGRRLGLIV